MTPRAHDLLGDVSEPAEVFRRLDALESMAVSLRARGLDDAASETLHLLEEARAFEQTVQSRSCRLGGLWKALETADNPHTPEAEGRRNITDAALAYRAVREQGTRRV